MVSAIPSVSTIVRKTPPSKFLMHSLATRISPSSLPTRLCKRFSLLPTQRMRTHLSHASIEQNISLSIISGILLVMFSLLLKYQQHQILMPMSSSYPIIIVPYRLIPVIRIHLYISLTWIWDRMRSHPVNIPLPSLVTIHPLLRSSSQSYHLQYWIDVTSFSPAVPWQLFGSPPSFRPRITPLQNHYHPAYLSVQRFLLSCQPKSWISLHTLSLLWCCFCFPYCLVFLLQRCWIHARDIRFCTRVTPDLKTSGQHAALWDLYLLAAASSTYFYPLRFQHLLDDPSTYLFHTLVSRHQIASLSASNGPSLAYRYWCMTPPFNQSNRQYKSLNPYSWYLARGYDHSSLNHLNGKFMV